MKKEKSSLVQQGEEHIGEYGGFPFGGQKLKGIKKHNQLPSGVEFPNGAKSAILVTFDVEGDYGNGAGDTKKEVSNYSRICDKFSECNIAATFNIVGEMVEDYGTSFIQNMVDAKCEVASHGYVHDMFKRYGGDKLYAGQYGIIENLQQVQDGVSVIEKLFPGVVTGIRLPYAHFNEYTYDAIEKIGLKWSSNTGIDDFINPSNGFGNGPFQIKMGNKIYPMVEIPFDTQTFDWAIWMADQERDTTFVDAVRLFCKKRGLKFERTPACAVKIWKERILESIENENVLALLCHPINLTVKNSLWQDPVDEFLFPIIEYLGELVRDKKIWVCTSQEMSDFYISYNQSNNRGDIV